MKKYLEGLLVVQSAKKPVKQPNIKVIPNKKRNKLAVAITGISFAGKSTLVRRLQTGHFNGNLAQTLGLDIEFIKHENTLIQLFDLGGQPAFRKLIWQNYVGLSHAIIFVLDATDRTALDDARKWFWQVKEWASNAKAIAFLANKWDLANHLSLEEIIEALALKEFAETHDKAFHIFCTSNKTGQNINEAFNWLKEQLFYNNPLKSNLIRSIHLFFPKNIPFLDLELNQINNPQDKPSTKFLSSILSVTDEFLSSDGVQSVSTDHFSMTIVRRKSVTCIIVSNTEDSTSDTRLLAENILEFSKENLSKDLSMDKIKERIKNFCIETCNSYLD